MSMDKQSFWGHFTHNRGMRSLATATVALGLCSLPAAGVVEIVGVTEASLEWTEASGPVAGYFVIVSRSGENPVLDQISATSRATVSGAYGEEIMVGVAAFDAGGIAGPLSLFSETIMFVAETSDGGDGSDPGGGGGGDGDDGSGAGEPVPEPDGAGSPFDFTGDGVVDLILQAGSALSLWSVEGSQVVAVRELPPVPSGSVAVGHGDYDGNGVSDVLWEDTETGALSLWLVDEGTVVAGLALSGPPLDPDGEWFIGGSADFDADGRDDILVASRVLGVVEIWHVDDAGGVTSGSRFGGRIGAWSIAALADTDGDGKAEIVWRDELAHVLEVDDPDAGTAQPIGQSVEGWRAAGVADVDGDGVMELVLYHRETGSLDAWSLDGTAPSVQALGALSGAPAGVYAGGDFDLDGREDLVWSEPAAGAIVLGLSTPSGLVETLVDASLPEGTDLARRTDGSDDGDFRDRLCGGDFDQNGSINSHDFQSFVACYQGTTSGDCYWQDMDGDGRVTTADAGIFVNNFRSQGQSCE